MKDDFSELLKRAVRGDSDAVSELFRRYEGIVRARVRDRMTPALRRRFDTADIGQSVFADVLRDLGDFEDRGEEKFRRWLYVRAERKLLSKQRKLLNNRGQQRESALPAPSTDAIEALIAPEPGPVTSAGHGDDVARLEGLLATLDDVTQRVIRMRARDKLTFAAIAARLELGTEDAARKRYRRGLMALKGRWPSRP
jgi:RNA polymerase sigma factor (sigma-70 family)